MKSPDVNQPQAELPRLSKFIEDEIDPFIKKYECQVEFNRFFGIGLNLVAIGLSLGITVAGINGNSRLAAGLGAASAATQAAFAAFPFERRVWFYRSSVAEAEKLKAFLKYKLLIQNHLI